MDKKMVLPLPNEVGGKMVVCAQEGITFRCWIVPIAWRTERCVISLTDIS